MTVLLILHEAGAEANYILPTARGRGRLVGKSLLVRDFNSLTASDYDTSTARDDHDSPTVSDPDHFPAEGSRDDQEGPTCARRESTTSAHLPFPSSAKEDDRVLKDRALDQLPSVTARQKIDGGINPGSQKMARDGSKSPPPPPIVSGFGGTEGDSSTGNHEFPTRSDDASPSAAGCKSVGNDDNSPTISDSGYSPAEPAEVNGVDQEGSISGHHQNATISDSGYSPIEPAEVNGVDHEGSSSGHRPNSSSVGGGKQYQLLFETKLRINFPPAFAATAQEDGASTNVWNKSTLSYFA